MYVGWKRERGGVLCKVYFDFVRVEISEVFFSVNQVSPWAVSSTKQPQPTHTLVSYQVAGLERGFCMQAGVRTWYKLP